MKTQIFGILLLADFLAGCTANNVVTKKEMETQNKAGTVVTEVMFVNDLSNSASYNIRKNGFVVIKFDESVSMTAYTEVVNLLRSSPDIHGVRAEQSGIEVCPLR